MGILLMLAALCMFCVSLVILVAAVLGLGMLVMRGIRALTTRHYKKKWGRG